MKWASTRGIDTALVDVAVIVELGRIVIVVVDVGCVIINMEASTTWALLTWAVVDDVGVVDAALVDMGCRR